MTQARSNAPSRALEKVRDSLPKNIALTSDGLLQFNIPTKLVGVFADVKSARPSLGLEPTPENIARCVNCLESLRLDIKKGEIQPLLSHYFPWLAPKVAQLLHLPSSKPQLTIGQLWDEFEAYETAGAKGATLRDRIGQRKKIEQFGDLELSQSTALLIRESCLKEGGQLNKRALAVLERAVDWAVRMDKAQIVKNPFHGMSKEVGVGQRVNPLTGIKSQYCAYLEWERDLIIETFKQERPTFYPIVFFLFHAGCRTGEAQALTWGDIDFNRGVIYFTKSYSYHLQQTEDSTKQKKKGGKESGRREFPMYPKLREWLEVYKLTNVNSDDLCFPNRKGNHIGASLKVAWGAKPRPDLNRAGGLVLQLATEGNLETSYLPPYNTRHTFISLAIEAGFDTINLADWCGNSDTVIQQVYYSKPRNVDLTKFK